MSATMSGMTDVEADAGEGVEFNLIGSLAVALLIGAALALTARTGAVELLVAVAAVQALLAFAVVYGLAVPGRFGALVIAALTAASADVLVSVWPHGHLGAFLAVFGLAVPVMFIHQLVRGAGRVRVEESLGAIALLVLAEVALPALLQLRHEFGTPALGAHVVFGVVLVAVGALAAGDLIDLVVAAPRFDADVPRGLLAVAGSAVIGGAVGQLSLHHYAAFAGGRGAFAGACLGALVALLAVAVAYLEYGSPFAEAGFARRVRPTLGVVVPLSILAPVAFLLCVAIRV